ncbi:hypothetical protein Scep_004617 [Stephania cephalantha]|uniref:Uncharacterized protein n=1 Tax=Stephania cephalantha TaxID=152367 RepID=A0AAP0KU69_9MAGN
MPTPKYGLGPHHGLRSRLLREQPVASLSFVEVTTHCPFVVASRPGSIGPKNAPPRRCSTPFTAPPRRHHAAPRHRRRIATASPSPRCRACCRCRAIGELLRVARFVVARARVVLCGTRHRDGAAATRPVVTSNKPYSVSTVRIHSLEVVHSPSSICGRVEYTKWSCSKGLLDPFCFVPNGKGKCQVLNLSQQRGRFNFTTQFPHYKEVIYKPDFGRKKLRKPVVFDMDMSSGDFLALIYLLKVPVEVIDLKITHMFYSCSRVNARVVMLKDQVKNDGSECVVLCGKEHNYRDLEMEYEASKVAFDSDTTTGTLSHSAKLQRRRQELTQTTPDQPVDDEAVYYKVAGDCPKGCVYSLKSLWRKKRRYVDLDASTSQMLAQRGMGNFMILRFRGYGEPIGLSLGLKTKKAGLRRISNEFRDSVAIPSLIFEE